MAVKASGNEYQQIYQLNQQLLQIAREGDWDNFLPAAEQYIAALHQMLSRQATGKGINPEDAALARQLLADENERKTLMRGHLDQLQDKIATLGKGARCNQAYANSF